MSLTLPSPYSYGRVIATPYFVKRDARSPRGTRMSPTSVQSGACSSRVSCKSLRGTSPPPTVLYSSGGSLTLPINTNLLRDGCRASVSQRSARKSMPGCMTRPVGPGSTCIASRTSKGGGPSIPRQDDDGSACAASEVSDPTMTKAGSLEKTRAANSGADLIKGDIDAGATERKQGVTAEPLEEKSRAAHSPDETARALYGAVSEHGAVSVVPELTERYPVRRLRSTSPTSNQISFNPPEIPLGVSKVDASELLMSPQDVETRLIHPTIAAQAGVLSKTSMVRSDEKLTQLERLAAKAERIALAKMVFRANAQGDETEQLTTATGAVEALVDTLAVDSVTSAEGVKERADQEILIAEMREDDTGLVGRDLSNKPSVTTDVGTRIGALSDGRCFGGVAAALPLALSKLQSCITRRSALAKRFQYLDDDAGEVAVCAVINRKSEENDPYKGQCTSIPAIVGGA